MINNESDLSWAIEDLTARIISCRDYVRYVHDRAASLDESMTITNHLEILENDLTCWLNT